MAKIIKPEVKIITPKDIHTFEIWMPFTSYLNALEQEGFDIEGVINNHFLAHTYKRHNEISDEYPTFVFRNKGKTAKEGWQKKYKDPFHGYRFGLEALKENARVYLDRYSAPYAAVTYALAANRVTKVFEDLGCKVERLERAQKLPKVA